MKERTNKTGAAIDQRLGKDICDVMASGLVKYKMIGSAISITVIRKIAFATILLMV